MSLSNSIEDREYSKFRDGNKVAVTNEDEQTSLRFEQVSSSVLYLATGLFGALDTELKWKIQKVEITGAFVSIKNASNAFDKAWSDRDILTYV